MYIVYCMLTVPILLNDVCLFSESVTYRQLGLEDASLLEGCPHCHKMCVYFFHMYTIHHKKVTLQL